MFWDLASKVAPPEWLRPIAWGALLVFLAVRLWRAAWSLTERYARQDATEATVKRLKTNVVRLKRANKKRGVQISMLIKQQEDQGSLLREIRDLLMAHGVEEAGR